MEGIKYIAKVLPDGHLSLPEEIREKMGLTANSRVKVVLFREIKDGLEYIDIEKMRAGWNEKTAGIDNV